MKVMFVCTGNICRSPTGEAVLNAKIEDRGWKGKVTVASSGTSSYHVGESADARTVRHGQARGYKFLSRAQQFESTHFQEYDLIVCMDEGHYKTVKSMDHEGQYTHKIVKMMSFSQKHLVGDVPDPYYEGSNGFEMVLDYIEDACDGLCDWIGERLPGQRS